MRQTYHQKQCNIAHNKSIRQWVDELTPIEDKLKKNRIKVLDQEREKKYKAPLEPIEVVEAKLKDMKARERWCMSCKNPFDNSLKEIWKEVDEEKWLWKKQNLLTPKFLNSKASLKKNGISKYGGEDNKTFLEQNQSLKILEESLIV